MAVSGHHRLRRLLADTVALVPLLVRRVDPRCQRRTPGSRSRSFSVVVVTPLSLAVVFCRHHPYFRGNAEFAHVVRTRHCTGGRQVEMSTPYHGMPTGLSARTAVRRLVLGAVVVVPPAWAIFGSNSHYCVGWNGRTHRQRTPCLAWGPAGGLGASVGLGCVCVARVRSPPRVRAIRPGCCLRCSNCVVLFCNVPSQRRIRLSTG